MSDQDRISPYNVDTTELTLWELNLTITRITNVIWELERLIECDWDVISQTRQERVFIECCKTLTKVI